MSTDAQHYSIPHQQSTIRAYAASHGMEVVRTYADEGKSGLTLAGREALAQLLSDVEKGRADFEAILVYDVSRWGRFQDVDESAYYEFLCHKANVRVAYCAEPFADQSGPLVDILKAIKRAMAAEYSRELSAKIAFAQRRGALLGNFQGGPPGFALRRMLVDPRGKQVQKLERGAHKGIKDYRTILTPGPAHEVETVQRIFHLYTEDRLFSAQIAQRLNDKGTAYQDDRVWTARTIRMMLRNERYVGSFVFNRTSSNMVQGRLRGGRKRNPQSEWIRSHIGFDGYISAEAFEKARKFRGLHAKSYSDDNALLAQLHALLEQKGHLSTDIINAAPGMPTPSVYLRHFGSLRRAYELIGFVSPTDWTGQPQSQHRQKIARQVIDRIIGETRARGIPFGWNGLKHELTIVGHRTVAAIVAHNSFHYGHDQWRIRTGREYLPDITVISLMDSKNHEPMGYLCVPRLVTFSLLNQTFRMSSDLKAFFFRTIDEVVERVLS